MAALLIAALGWPSTTIAAGRAATAAEAPAKTEPAEPAANDEAAPENEAEPAPTSGTAPAPEGGATPDASAGSQAGPSPAELVQHQADWRKEQAAQHWLEGERLFQNGRYAEAAAEFEHSQAAVPAAATLYSVALSYSRAGKPVEAIRALKRYLAMPGCEGVPDEERSFVCTEQRPEAEELLSEQRLRVGELVLELAQGVRLREVRVAGRVIPLDDFPLVLLPGTFDVEVFGPGPEEHRTRTVYITGGETSTFYVPPFETETGQTVDPRRDDEPVIDELAVARRRLALQIGFGVGAGLTLISGTAMGVMGGLTLYHQRRFDTEICENPCPPGADEPYPADHEAKFERYKPITNALVGVTVGLAVATALLGTFAFRKGARDRASDGRTGVRARVRRHVGLGGSGLVVRW